MATAKSVHLGVRGGAGPREAEGWCVLTGHSDEDLAGCAVALLACGCIKMTIICKVAQLHSPKKT